MLITTHINNLGTVFSYKQKILIKFSKIRPSLYVIHTKVSTTILCNLFLS